jgi:hypothetical protein
MAIKSAYELAMERMGKGGQPAVKLTDAQKKQLAELDSLYKSKIAELELRLKPKIDETRMGGNEEEADKLRSELTKGTQSLREELESKKEKVRVGKSV